MRVHPEATVRPWATCEVIGDALSFASALGYVSVHARVFIIYSHPYITLSLDNDRKYTNVGMRFVEEL